MAKNVKSVSRTIVQEIFDLSPTSGGKGVTQVNIKSSVDEKGNRVAQERTITIQTTAGLPQASKTVKCVLEPKPLFIKLDDNSGLFNCPATGIPCEVYGTSNGYSLGIDLNSVFGQLKFSIIDFMVMHDGFPDWVPIDNGQEISGDPGALGTYRFKFTLIVLENPDEVAIEDAVQVFAFDSDGKTTSVQVRVNQEASVVTYQMNTNAPSRVPASGWSGTVTIPAVAKFLNGKEEPEDVYYNLTPDLTLETPDPTEHVLMTADVMVVKSWGADLASETKTAYFAEVVIPNTTKRYKQRFEVVQEANEIVRDFIVENDAYWVDGNTDEKEALYPPLRTIDVAPDWQSPGFCPTFINIGIGLTFTSGESHNPTFSEAKTKYKSWHDAVSLLVGTENDPMTLDIDGEVVVDAGGQDFITESYAGGQAYYRDMESSDNDTSSERQGYIGMTWKHLGEPSTLQRCTVVQAAANHLTVSPTELTFTAEGGSQTINIDTNESWTIE